LEFVIVMARLDPAVAVLATFMLAVIVVELTMTTLEKVTPLGPLRVAPVANPVPLITTDLVVPGATVDGLMPVSVGATSTLRQLVHVPLPPSVLVTVTV
jgi:hypothetical protein